MKVRRAENRQFFSSLYWLKMPFVEWPRFKFFKNKYLLWDLSNSLYPLTCQARDLGIFLSGSKPLRVLNFIHIGKCGGTSVRQAVYSSQKVRSLYDEIRTIHVARPIFRRNVDYLVVIRNPIERAISAFNWRFKIVVEQSTQSSRFKGEKNSLLKYKTLNNLAESLYNESGNLCAVADYDYRSIHHLREGIDFYLHHQFFALPSNLIYGVIIQSSLTQDCARLLDVDFVPEKNKNSSRSVKSRATNLSSLARTNLRKYLYKEYRCILQMREAGLITSLEYNELIF